jgi:hypothetical protein
VLDVGGGKALETLAPPTDIRWTDWSRAANADYVANQEAEAVEPLDMAEVVKTIQRLAPADSVLTNGAGNFSGWLHRYYRYPALPQGGRSQLAPTSGAMGYGLPAAVAASLLHPERTCDQHRRRRRLPDDRTGARDRHRLWRRQGPWPTDQHRRRQRHLRARSGCTRSASTRAGSAAAICTTPISSRWRGPTDGAPNGSMRPPGSRPRSAPR